MPPKIRSPLLTWLLTVITGGIYLVFWAWLAANELNFAERKNVFNTQLWRKLFITSIFLGVVGIIVIKRAGTPLPLLVSFSLLLGLFLNVQLAFGNYVKSKDAELNTGSNFSNALSALLFWFVGNVGIAYLQSGINRIIRHERAK